MYESIKKTNPNWKFVIGLIDKNTTNADLSFIDCSIIEVEQIEIEDFQAMVNNYSIVELLTSVKPYYIDWLFTQFKEAKNVVYFDPDIMVFQPLDSLEKSLDSYDIILTPHFTSPINDNCLPTELHVMQTGVFNLGFIAVKQSLNSLNMLNWWKSRLKNQCLINLSRGLFVDQLWANLIPAYFDKVLIEKNPGYNMAHWNFHERYLTCENNVYYANGNPLIFFHFSHYSPVYPNNVASHHNRFSFETRPDLINIYSLYKASLLAYYYNELKKVKCFYINNEQKKKRKRAFENFIRIALPDKWKGKLKKITGR